MSLLAVALVLVAAVMHATWNLLAKRTGGGAEFVWLFGLLSIALYAPFMVAVVLIERPHFDLIVIVFLAGTGVLHTAYFLFLQRGYRSGDLSLVYPLARGSGPLLATVVAVALLGERPGFIALGGTLLILSGVLILTSGPQGWRGK